MSTQERNGLLRYGGPSRSIRATERPSRPPSPRGTDRDGTVPSEQIALSPERDGGQRSSVSSGGRHHQGQSAGTRVRLVSVGSLRRTPRGGWRPSGFERRRSATGDGVPRAAERLPGSAARNQTVSAGPRVSRCPISCFNPLPGLRPGETDSAVESSPTVTSDDSAGDPSGGGHPRRTTLEDSFDDTPVSASASRIRSPRIDATRLSLRQRRVAGEPGRNPVWTPLPSAHLSVSEPSDDPDYAALRATLLSLAREGSRLLGPNPQDHAATDPRAARGLLQRIDQFEEQVDRQGMEPVRRWVHALKCRVHKQAAADL